MLTSEARNGFRSSQFSNMTAPTIVRVVYRYPVFRQCAGLRLRLLRRERRYVMSGRAKLFHSHGYRSSAVSFNIMSISPTWDHSHDVVIGEIVGARIQKLFDGLFRGEA
jgi:hypothetical protein